MGPPYRRPIRTRRDPDAWASPHRVWDGWRCGAPPVDCVRNHTILEYCLWKQFSQNDVCWAYTSIPVISLKRLLYAMNKAFFSW